jgi:hypothetical protein
MCYNINTKERKEIKKMKTATFNGETFSYYISNEFDGNHILHMTSSKRGKLDVWWGLREPSGERMSELFDQHRGKIGG